MKSCWPDYLKGGISFLLLSTLSGCMVGPQFHAPQSPQTQSYTEAPLPKKTTQVAIKGTAGRAQYFIDGRDIPAEWWTVFRSPTLNALIQAGMTKNPTLAAAEATLRQSEETLRAQIGNLMFPAVNAQLGGQRQSFSAATLGEDVPSSIFNLYNASVNVSYTLDVFGGSRRQLEALRAQVDYQQFQLIATYLTLTANIVTTAFNISSLQAQIDATSSLLSDQEKQLQIIKSQFKLGGVSNIDVLTQETLVQQTRASLPPLQQNLSQAKHALSILIGEFPNHKIPTINLDNINLPSQLPVSLPSRLVRQRPDVRASEALLHAASAQVGVATANLFPQITLSGDYGWSSATPSSLFRPSTNVWDYGGQLLQPIFNAGALRAQKRAAIAAFDAAYAQYQQTVLQAFKNVADTLRALDLDAKKLRAERNAEQAAFRNLKLSEDQYRLGGINYLTLLTAQQQYQQAKLGRITAQAQRYADTAALFQSLGGGWWNRTPHPCQRDTINPTHVSLSCPE